MKTTALSLVALGLLAGCHAAPMHPASGCGDLLLAASLQRALVAQSTLFPYHFVPGSSELNELGRRDLLVLAYSLQEHSGSLVVRRGDASPELAEARVRSVIAALESAGVARDHVTIHDGLPGGDGLASARVLDILKNPLTLSGAGVSTTVNSATATTANNATIVSP